MPLIEVFAPRGVSYVGEGELARICKIAHNVMLGVVIENLIEITLLANKMGVPRHAFLAFINNRRHGLDVHRLQVAGAGQSRLDHDLHAGTAAQGPRSRPRARPRDGRADAGDGGDPRGAAEAISAHAMLQKNPEEYLAKDFAALAETMALAAGMKLEPENKNVPTGLE